MAVPYTFATATSSIPLSQLDANFATGITLGNTTVYLGNTTTSFGNVTLTNVTISNVATTFPNTFLANSSVTLGTTNVSLGGTATTLANLTLSNVTISGGTSTATQNLANVTGTLVVGNGGTGLTSLTSGYIPYGNGTSAFSSSSALTFDGNNLGIGGTQSYSGYRTLLVQGTNISNGGVIQIQNSDSSVQAYWLNTSGLVTFGSVTSTPVGFITGNTEKMRLTSAGYLGIGTSSPSYPLDVLGSQINLRSGSSSTHPILSVGRTSQELVIGVAAGSSSIIVGDAAGDVDFQATSGAFNWSVNNGATLNMKLDASGNLGLGVTPSAWGAIKPLEFINGVFLASYNVANVANLYLGCNTYYNGSNWIYKTTDYASYYQQSAGKHLWFTASSQTSGSTATFTQAMALDASGNLLVGTTSSTGSATNSSIISGGIFSTVNGSTASTASGTAVTAFTATNNIVYMVSAYINATGAPTLYNAVAIVKFSAGTGVVTNLSLATNLSITVSGTNVQLTQTSGSPQVMIYNAMRLS